MDINKLYKVINEGGVAVIPTDTVYGIVADAMNEDVVNKVFDIKNREYSKPLIIMVSSIDMLKKYVKEINDIENSLIKDYWPGRLTILFRKNNNISDLITSGSDLVGIRYPDDNELIELINMLDRPIISTSANLSKKDTIVSIDMLEDDIKSKVDYIYDGGVILDKVSTIVKVNDGMVNIIREGDLTSSIKNKYIN